MKLAFVQVIALRPSQPVDLHKHPVLELVYYRSGKGSSRLEGQPEQVGPHIFTITPAGEHHDQINRSTLASICFGIEGSGLEDCKGVHRDRGGELGRACERLAGELASGGIAHAQMVDGLLLQVVALARRAASESAQPSRSEEIAERALSIIRSEAGMVTVSELSEQLFVSKDYLRHLLKERSGQSPLRHIIEARVEHARKLLADSELSVSEVSERCGFSSPYYFSRLFKQVTGRSPSQSRRGR